MSSRIEVLHVVERFLRKYGEVTSPDLAQALGVSRQSAHYRLRQLAAEGRLSKIGKGRASRYARTLTKAS